VAASDTLTGLVQAQLQSFEQNSGYINVSQCGQPRSSNVPGKPVVPGAFQAICFTAASQNGAAQPIGALIFDGLVQGNGVQLQVTAIGYGPQQTSSAVLRQVLVPELNSARWLQLTSSGGS
jgi:hypothetical protein